MLVQFRAGTEYAQKRRVLAQRVVNTSSPAAGSILGVVACSSLRQICFKANGTRVSTRWSRPEYNVVRFPACFRLWIQKIGGFIPTSGGREVPSSLRTSNAVFPKSCSRSVLRFENMILVVYGEPQSGAKYTRRPVL